MSVLKDCLTAALIGLYFVGLAILAICAFLFVIFVANRFADFLGLWEA